MRPRDFDIIHATAELLRGNTVADDNVFEWRKTPTGQDVLPWINITMDQRDYQVDNSLGAYKTDRRLAIILAVKGEDQDDADSNESGVISALDDFEAEVVEALEVQPTASPPIEYPVLRTVSGVLRLTLSQVLTRREEKDNLYALRYMIYSVWTKDKIKGL